MVAGTRFSGTRFGAAALAPPPHAAAAAMTAAAMMTETGWRAVIGSEPRTRAESLGLHPVDPARSGGGVDSRRRPRAGGVEPEDLNWWRPREGRRRSRTGLDRDLGEIDLGVGDVVRVGDGRHERALGHVEINGRRRGLQGDR